MTVTVQLSVGGSPVPDEFYDAISQLEVEESSEGSDTLLLRLPVNRTSGGDLQFIGDGTFEPFTPITLVMTPAGKSAQCVFDGYLLAWQLHLDRSSGSSTVDMWAQDASWLMNVADTSVEWAGMTDGEVANAIFSNYGFTPADANTDDDSPTHDQDLHSLIQRGTDLQFLRGLARRGGRVLRVACTDTPGDRTGYFVRPSVDASASTTISLVDPDAWTVDQLDFDWDVMRPVSASASQVDVDDIEAGGTAGDSDSSGLDPLDSRDYASYTSSTATSILTAPADAGELTYRTTGLLGETGLFVRCTGEVDADRLGGVLRVGQVVTIEGAGSIQSGDWLVWNVRHQIRQQSIRMQFTLVRNAMGPAAAGSSLASAFGGSGGVGIGVSL